MSKSYDVSREEVDNAWNAVRKADGKAGFDGKTIEEVEVNLDAELYKIWNRLSSGSYMPAPVLLVKIPKVKGGTRQLGIPTVLDRVAQGVIKNRLEAVVQSQFHTNSYAYQANKSTIDAVGLCRERCMSMKWVVDIDIKGFFDNLDHDLMLQIVEKYTQDKLVLLYVKKFLKAKGINGRGEEAIREKGTPQGGVISPLLANLYLHEAFDLWMKENFSDIQFERYADDIIVHCVSEKQAHFIRDRIEGRLKLSKLELNTEKTKIVYTGRDNSQDHRGHSCPRKFVFLGYEFKPRTYFGKLIYTPGMGAAARVRIRNEVKRFPDLRLKFRPIEKIAAVLNPKIRGWINYYGHFRRSELYKMGRDIDSRLVRWLCRKHKPLTSLKKGWKYLVEIREARPKLFEHWYRIRSSPIRAV